MATVSAVIVGVASAGVEQAWPCCEDVLQGRCCEGRAARACLLHGAVLDRVGHHGLEALVAQAAHEGRGHLGREHTAEQRREGRRQGAVARSDVEGSSGAAARPAVEEGRPLRGREEVVAREAVEGVHARVVVVQPPLERAPHLQPRVRRRPRHALAHPLPRLLVERRGIAHAAVGIDRASGLEQRPHARPVVRAAQAQPPFAPCAQPDVVGRREHALTTELARLHLQLGGGGLPHLLHGDPPAAQECTLHAAHRRDRNRKHPHQRVGKGGVQSRHAGHVGRERTAYQDGALDHGLGVHVAHECAEPLPKLRPRRGRPGLQHFGPGRVP